MTDAGPPVPDDLAAAEHALGLLEAEARAAAGRRVLSDPAFAREVEAWSARLAPMSGAIAPREPPAHLWPQIAARLTHTGAVAELRLRRSLTIWRLTGAGSGLAAAGLALALLWPRAQPQPANPAAPRPAPPVQAASLSGPRGGGVVFVAVLDPQRRELVLTPTRVKAGWCCAPELWVIPAGGKPVAVGVGAFGRPVRLRVDAALGGAARRTLAVSLEPAGGSPTGQPTGAVVAGGELQAL